MRSRILGLTGLCSVVLLGACTTYRGLDRERVQACVDHAGITGQYRMSFSLRGDQTRVLVYPGPGVSEAQAATANACIAQAMDTPLGEAFDAESIAPQPRYTERQRGAAVLSGGSGYHGAYLEGGSGASRATAQPEKAVKAPKAAKGKLPLPVQYPLMPGDAELWPTLTLDQQKRALVYLQDGSTILASLGESR